MRVMGSLLPAGARIALLCIVLVAIAANIGVNAEITAASIVPTTLAAGAVTDAEVIFKTTVDIDIGGQIMVELPAGMMFLSGAGTNITVNQASSTTLVPQSASTAQLYVAIGSAPIIAETSFIFTIADVLNPAEGSTGDFTITTFNSSGNVLDTNVAVPSVTIIATAFSSAVSIVPDSLDAGVVGTTTIAFVSDVDLPVDSILKVTFPSDFTVISTAISAASNIDSGSVITQNSSAEVSIEIVGSTVTKGAAVSFKIDGITNPGEMTTGMFSFKSMDSSKRIYQYDTAIAGVSIKATPFASDASAIPDVNYAGVSAIYDFRVALNVSIPLDGYFMVQFPREFTFEMFATVPRDVFIVDHVMNGAISEQTVKFEVSIDYPVGEHSFLIGSVQNPGATLTHAFTLSTADAKGNLLQSQTVSGVQIVPGNITDATMAYVLPHPGITSKTQINFTTSAVLAQESRIYIQLPQNDYDAATASLTIDVLEPAGKSAIVTWVMNDTGIMLRFTNEIAISEHSKVSLVITALQMPPSIRSTTLNASIQTWNAAGQQLDGPNTLLIAEITAVQDLLCRWSAVNPHPGITSTIIFTFQTSGAIPVGGMVAISLSGSDFSAVLDKDPKVTFLYPTIGVATAIWNATINTLIFLVEGYSPIPDYSTDVQVEISTLNTPPSVRPSFTLLAAVTTYDPLGIVIDGPSPLQIDPIISGPILQSRIWMPQKPFPGVTSDQNVSFSIHGRIDVGGCFEFTLPKSGWSMGALMDASFTTPALGAVGLVSWNETTRLLTITLTGTIGLSAHSQINLVISNVLNPPRETAVNDAYVVTKASDGKIIDGPEVLSVMNISRGTFGGTKTWTSITTDSASMKSHQLLNVTLNGALPSGSTIRIILPSDGWRMFNSSSTASFQVPAAGISINSTKWDPLASELYVQTNGDLDEGAIIELIFEDMINPYSAQPARTLQLTTMLADSGVVDEGYDIIVNEIQIALLPSNGSWVSAVATPGVESTQTITLITGGSLEVGASICLTVPTSDGWSILYSATGSLRSAGESQSSDVFLTWDAKTEKLCVQIEVAIAQERTIAIIISNVRSATSLRPMRMVPLLIQSHLGGNVNSGFVVLNAITEGLLTGPLIWQSAMYSPGPVADLVTSATLTFKTTGRIPTNGEIMLSLPVDWVIAVNCVVTFIVPVVGGIASCIGSEIRIRLLDDINEYSLIELSLTGVHNPPTVQPSGLAIAQIFAPDGGIIDESVSIVTSAIVAAVTNITNIGDQRVAVVDVAKTFFFEGYALAEGDVIKFMDTSTTNDLNCGTATSGQSDVGGISVVSLDSNQSVTLKFTQSSLDEQPFVICYKFGANPFKLYRNLSFTVKQIVGMVTDVGVASVAVANYPKTWTFSGNGISHGDLIRWIDLDVVNNAILSSISLDCLDTSTLAKLESASGQPLVVPNDDYTRVIWSSKGSTFAFAQENAGKTFCLCYKFGNEPYTIYPSLSVQVNHISAVRATISGNNSIAVVDAPKQFTFTGDGLRLNDRIYFIEIGSAASCVPSSTDPTLRFGHTIADIFQTVLFISNTGDTVVNFVDAAAGKTVVPCYQFEIEPYQLYPDIQLHVQMVTSFSGPLGSPLLAVAGVTEPLTFRGFGVSESDKVRWILRGQEDCESNLASLVDPDTLLPIDTITLDSDVSGLFNFSSLQIDYSPLLCYKFGMEEFKLYLNLSIHIGTIKGKASNTGARDVAVVNSRKTFELFGTNLAVNDRVGWTTESTEPSACANLSLLIRNPIGADDDFLSYTAKDNTVSIALASLSSGKRVYLCYGFGTEPLKLYSNLYLDVKSILNMRSFLGSNNVAVAGTLKTFQFLGDGVMTGDFAKFVSESNIDCSSPGISLLNIIDKFDDYAEMAMYLYESVAGVTVGNFKFALDNDTAGLSRMLCYRFGIEPFTLYENIKLDVKTIWGLYQSDKTVSGQAEVAVVNERKLIAIDGVGVSESDQVKFIDEAAMSDQDCTDMIAKGISIHQMMTVFANKTVWFPFEYGSNGSTWKLCYKFGDESYRLYSSIGVFVKEITQLLDFNFQSSSLLGMVATINHLKEWLPIGSGILDGDIAKFVSQSVTSSGDCGESTLNMVSGTSLMSVTAPNMIFTGKFSEFPVSSSDVYHLCYKFQDEPFTYIQGIEVLTYGIMGLDRSVILVNAATPIQVSGFRLANTDQLAWTSDSTSCSTLLDISDVTNLKSTVLFSKPYSQLFLCYSFDRQPFELFPSISIEVVKAEIWIPQTVTIVADQDVKITVDGTFGLTVSSDQIAWVPSSTAECSDDTVEIYAEVMQTSISSVAKSKTAIARGGSAVFKVRYVAPVSGSGITAGDVLSTWKLCYRFGNMANYLMFGDVLCNVLDVNEVELLEIQPSETGSVMKFQFTGIGIQDFDAAKWVSAEDAKVDTDCSTLPAIGGSKTMQVINGMATFTFSTQSSGSMALCYEFLGHAFKLYSSIPVKDLSTSATQSGQSFGFSEEDVSGSSSNNFNVNRDLATVALTLDKDINDIPAASPAEVAFKASFVSALADSLGIDPSRIQIIELLAGSVIVKFELLPSKNVADPLVLEIMAELEAQLSNPESDLLQNSFITITDPSSALTYEITQQPALPAAAFNIRPVGYQRNGLFTFAKGVYSVTEKTAKLVVPVLRLQGSASPVTLVIQMVEETATYMKDYRFTSIELEDTNSFFLRFELGATRSDIEIQLLDDAQKEAHFEYFTLTMLDPATPDTALGTTPQVTVQIYDYGDSSILVQSTFAFTGDRTKDVQGWTIVENGKDHLPRVDTNGIFAIDAVFGEAEYNQACDLASPTGPCSYTCELGGNLLSMEDFTQSKNVFQLDGQNYVATFNAMDSFPTTALSVSLWVKTGLTDLETCLFSYAVASEQSSAVQLALCNPSNLHVFINANSNAGGIATFVDVTDDQWHFLAVTWNPEDGRVYLYDNGMLVFDGGPYRVHQSLMSGGIFVLGQLVLSGSTTAPCTTNVEATSIDGAQMTTVDCEVIPNTGLIAQVQHVHIWSRVLTRSELLKELAWPMQVTTNGLVLGWNFDTQYLQQQRTIVNDFSLKGQEQTNNGYLHCGLSPCLITGVTASITTTFPCGQVYRNIWHFAAPIKFRIQLAFAYGGRLQFRMLAPSFNGSPRHRRGQISIFSKSATVQHISLALSTFALPTSSTWTYYSVILREDFGWISEPSGEPLTVTEFKDVLASASALWIRGDLWGYDSNGSGQEVVYLNDVILYGR